MLSSNNYDESIWTLTSGACCEQNIRSMCPKSKLNLVVYLFNYDDDRTLIEIESEMKQ